jgi:hypothetical protein
MIHSITNCNIVYNIHMIRYDRQMSKLFGYHVFITLPDPRNIQEVPDEPWIVASLDLDLSDFDLDDEEEWPPG